MVTQFKAVELDDIQAGQFREKCEEDFRQLSRDFVAFTEEHEVSASASLTMKVNLKYDQKTKSHTIVTVIETKIPKDPAGVTTAFVAEDQGEKCLFAKVSGTEKDNPRQTVLCTPAGDNVDLGTGEVTAKQ